jgi:pimeloyl-ACP methyl ester carboxylesterase
VSRSTQVEVAWRGRTLQLECQWIGEARQHAPTLVFLHEGLGSLAMWKDFPARVCAASGLRGLVYSRPGYGRSTPRAPDERWPVRFMHEQAFEVLPALLSQLGIQRPWLFGHSDGGSIALLHASALPTAGVIAVAAHVFVEEFGLRSIEAARLAYETTDLPARLARYHADVDTMPTSIRPSGGGTTSGWTRRFARGTSKPSSTRSTAPCSWCRARTTSTARWNKYGASRAACRMRRRWCCRTAGIHRTATSPSG